MKLFKKILCFLFFGNSLFRKGVKFGKGSYIREHAQIGGGRHIKLVIAVGKGKKKYDKRETIKKRDIERGRYA